MERIPTVHGVSIEVSPSGLVALLDLCLQLALCRADLNRHLERHRAEQTYRRIATRIDLLIAGCARAAALADHSRRYAAYSEALAALEKEQS